MTDLPDFYLRTVTEAMEATSFRGGADAAKPAAPVSRDIYYATDTKILYVCVADGAWVNINALYLLLAGGTMTGAIAMGGNKVTGLGAPAAAADAARKAEVDAVDAKLDDTSVASPVRILDTIYHNGAKLRVVCISWFGAGVESGTLLGRIGLASPPDKTVGFQSLDFVNYPQAVSMTFLVPASYYYDVVLTGDTPTTQYWTEIDLF